MAKKIVASSSSPFRAELFRVALILGLSAALGLVVNTFSGRSMPIFPPEAPPDEPLPEPLDAPVATAPEKRAPDVQALAPETPAQPNQVATDATPFDRGEDHGGPDQGPPPTVAPNIAPQRRAPPPAPNPTFAPDRRVPDAPLPVPVPAPERRAPERPKAREVDPTPGRVSLAALIRAQRDPAQAVRILDVRGESTFNSGHIPLSINAPLETILKSQASIDAMLRDATLTAVLCDSDQCSKAETAAETLKNLGYKNVRVLNGGWEGYKRSNLPVETSREGARR